MGNGGSGRTPEEIAREHEQIQREVENRENQLEGGIYENLGLEIAASLYMFEPTDEPSSASDSGDDVVLRKLHIGKDPLIIKPQVAFVPKVIDDNKWKGISTFEIWLESTFARVSSRESSFWQVSQEHDSALLHEKDKRRKIRIFLTGVGPLALGFIFLYLGLRAEGDEMSVAKDAIVSPTFTFVPFDDEQPILQVLTVTGAATANASFEKESGPCNFAANFTDSYDFVALEGALKLTQLSNGHESSGTISPDGTFVTMSDGQGYSGTLIGTTATGQHTYTAEGCNEIYNFTMILSEPLLVTGGQVSTTTNPPPEVTSTTSAVTDTSMSTTSLATGTGGEPNLLFVLLGTLLILGGLAVVLRGPILIGGWQIRKEAAKDPCDREKAVAAAARERLERARVRDEQISNLSDASNKAQREAETKTRAVEDAKRGASYGEYEGVRHYTNKNKAAEIGVAETAAAAAREDVAGAKTTYDVAGGQNELTAAQDELYKANRDWEQANESLQRCLQLFAPPPPPSTTAGGTTAGGTTTPSGPTIATGSSPQTREQNCKQDEVKPGHETTREITVTEIDRAEIILNAHYPGALYTPLTEFVEFMESFRKAFKVTKAIRTLVSGTIVEGVLDTVDATGIIDVPDFLTYWDKLTEATLKGLQQTGDIFIQRFGKLGKYELRFTRLTYTATCRHWEVCDNERWVQKSEVKVEITKTEHNSKTREIEVHDEREIADTIHRLFLDLERENERGTQNLRAFEKSCRR